MVKVDNAQTIQAQLQLVGVLTVEQRQRLLEIADRCPINKLLLAETSIQTVLSLEQ